MPALGISKGYRPRPRGFRDLFVRVGWAEIEDECRANKRAVFRWIREENAEAIREAAVTGAPLTLLESARDAWLEARYAERGMGKPGRKPGSRKKVR